MRRRLWRLGLSRVTVISSYVGDYLPPRRQDRARPITDPAGTYSGPGASAPTLAAAGTYIPVTGATSAAAEITDPAGTYSLAGASAPTLRAARILCPDRRRQLRDAGFSWLLPTARGRNEGAPALPPTISGAVAGQSTPSGQTDTPFSSVTIADPNIDTTDSLSIQLTGGGGALSDGAGFNGLTESAPGVYAPFRDCGRDHQRTRCACFYSEHVLRDDDIYFDRHDERRYEREQREDDRDRDEWRASRRVRVEVPGRSVDARPDSGRLRHS